MGAYRCVLHARVVMQSQEIINRNLRRDAQGGGAACVVSEFTEEAGHSIGAPSGVNTTKDFSTSSDTALSRLHIEVRGFARGARTPTNVAVVILDVCRA